jgi:hypothetical protein
MHKFVFLCKTYHKDLSRVLNLITSYVKHNKENIPLYISVSQNDYNLFKSSIDTAKVHLIIDESITNNIFVEQSGDFSKGYMNQQIIKLNFWKLNLCDSYMCLDSDSYFIKDFYLSDFLSEDGTPYTVLYQDKESSLNPVSANYQADFIDKIKIIQDSLGFQDRRYLSCCGFAIFSCKVLKSFEEKYLIPNNLNYCDILKKVPLEFSWYNQWLLKDKTVKIYPIEQLFKIFHYKSQYSDAQKKLISESDIAKCYIGICMNSNWYPFAPPLKYKNPYRISFCIYNLKNKLLKRFFKSFRGIIRYLNKNP